MLNNGHVEQAWGTVIKVISISSFCPLVLEPNVQAELKQGMLETPYVQSTTDGLRKDCYVSMVGRETEAWNVVLIGRRPPGFLTNILCDPQSEEQNQIVCSLHCGVDSFDSFNLVLVPALTINGTGLDQTAKMPLSSVSPYWLLGSGRSHNIHLYSLVLTN